jgi:uncharacterized membrane protein YfcA
MTDHDDRPGPLDPDGDGPSPAPSGNVVIGPILGVVIGYITFQLLPDDTSIWLAFGIVLVVIAVVTYAAIEISRRRSRRG